MPASNFINMRSNIISDEPSILYRGFFYCFFAAMKKSYANVDDFDKIKMLIGKFRIEGECGFNETDYRNGWGRLFHGA